MTTELIEIGGSKVLYTPIKSVQGVHIYFEFAAGSFNDPKGKLGVAHFCEHILAGFATTNKTQEQRWSERRRYQGGNASTSCSMMRFYLFTIAKHFTEAMDFLTDPFANVIISEEEFERERKVISDEIVTRVKTNSMEAWVQYNQKVVKEPHFNRQHSYPAGSVESLNKITIDDVKEYIKKYLNLDNLIISIVGNVSKKEVIKAIKDFVLPRFGKNGECGFLTKNLDHNIMAPAKLIHAPAVEQGKSLIQFYYEIDFKPFSGKMEEGDYRRGIISKYLSEHMFELLRLNNGLCYSCSSRVRRENRVCAVCDSIQCAEENLDRVVEEYLNHLHTLPVDMDRAAFEKFKQQICENENYDVLNLLQISDRVYDAYDSFKLLDYKKVIKYNMKRYASVTYDEVNELYKKLFLKKPIVVIISNNEKYRDKEFEKELYKKIKKATKK